MSDLKASTLSVSFITFWLLTHKKGLAETVGEFSSEQLLEDSTRLLRHPWTETSNICKRVWRKPMYSSLRTDLNLEMTKLDKDLTYNFSSWFATRKVLVSQMDLWHLLPWLQSKYIFKHRSIRKAKLCIYQSSYVLGMHVCGRGKEEEDVHLINIYSVCATIRVHMWESWDSCGSQFSPLTM